MPYDYARAKREAPALKAALTKASKNPDPEERYRRVKNACIAALRAWENWGAWPDRWRDWERALEDAYFNLRRNPDGAINPIPDAMPRLEEL